ncbi:putative glycerol-3-phosphate acyltransferase 3 [Dichanthelium oligosanthes]|uniref:Putative glycerol-3-phosphate acyltransferase 3 n=1 Tax=Dichanthelium oligosanthes TaxID=888268 RepID=A0A1E5V5U8_9POAL|nr:putative glycerol-3-phosphate acyltransferase 3 [Dichanthelium oligosanthes]
MVKKPFALPRSFLSLRRRRLWRSISGQQPRCTTSATGARTPPAGPAQDKLKDRTVLVDVEGWLLRSPLSTFPYFMLVAVEAGGFLRGLLLLLMYPVLCVLALLGLDDLRLKAMVMVSLFGLRQEEVARISKAVLPKFFLEDVAMEGLEAFKKAGTVVAVTAAFPRVMLEGFLKEYLGVHAVIGREAAVAAGRYVGFLEEEHADMGRVGAFLEEMEETRSKGDGAVGLVGAVSSRVHHVVSRYCKESYVLSEADKKAWQPLMRDKYPNKLVFHDGRLAFRPTFLAALAMYTYLPWGVFLAVFRSLAFGILPYRISVPLAAVTGMRSRLIAGPSPDSTEQNQAGGRLYVCNHRTLLDPITIAAGLNKPVTAVTYSVSPVSELIAPIRTARLTRDRDDDRRRMEALLARGDLVVCPEGTTCREAYLLRFSPLFAELTSEVTPVALETHVDMFYGTSTKPGAKWLDPFYFMMNSRPEYRVEFLERVTTVPAEGEVGGHGHSIQAANRVQRVLGEALGFEITGLTRKDKYMMLAGNEGVVAGDAKNN